MGEVSYRPLIEDMTWSYSRLEIFDSCPYRWYLQYIHTPKLPKEKKFYAMYGLFMHDLLENYYSGRMSKSEVLTTYLTQFSEKTKGSGRPKWSTVKSYFTKGKDYLKQLKPMPYKAISIEEKVDFCIGNVRLTGRVDYLGVDEDGNLVITDHKSRDLKPRSNRKTPTLKDEELDKMLRQLYLYAEGIRQKYGKLPTKLCFNCFKNGVFIEELFNEDAYRKAILWAQQKVEEISNSEEFPPNIEYFGCNFLCDYSSQCCYLEGGDSK